MKAHILVDLGYGDSGKGSITDYLVRKHGASLVVRYNGGSQCGHNVVTPDGKHHEFCQFGSGTLAGADTYLSRHVMINPIAMLNEADHLEELGVRAPLSKVYVDDRAPITTPFHVITNQLREKARGNARHGSCGRGIGETAYDLTQNVALYVRDLQAGHARDLLLLLRQIKAGELIRDGIDAASIYAIGRDKIDEWLDYYRKWLRQVRIVTSMPGADSVVFEGAQGILLDETYGFQPHTTWSDCTPNNAIEIALENEVDDEVDAYVMGIARAYMTRHGAGPLVTETSEAIQIALKRDEHNDFNRWQGTFRVGYTDLLALRYASDVIGGVDALAVTCLDRIAGGEWKACSGYRIGGDVLEAIPVMPDPSYEQQEDLTWMLNRCKPIYDEVEPSAIPELYSHVLGAPVVIESHGPTYHDKEVVERERDGAR